MLLVVLRRAAFVLAVLAVLALLGACQHRGTKLERASPPLRHNVLRLGARWADVTAAAAATGPPATTASDVKATFGHCPAAAYTVRAVAAHPGAAVGDMAVVEIDAASCGGVPPTLTSAAAQAKAFFPDLSGVVQRRPTAVVYSSQPLVRLVPPAAFFVCQSLAASPERLGRFSLRLEPTGWKLAVGDCVSDAPAGSPNVP